MQKNPVLQRGLEMQCLPLVIHSLTQTYIKSSIKLCTNINKIKYVYLKHFHSHEEARIHYYIFLFKKKNLCFRIRSRTLGSNPDSTPLLTMYPSQLSSLCLSFLIKKMGAKDSRGWDLNKLIYKKYLAWCLVHSKILHPLAKITYPPQQNLGFSSFLAAQHR